MAAGADGYPIVDAGMRELWQTGWMHNRVRMITASFLVKHLLIPWQEGEAWFWDCLAEADLAANAASWQWVAGCGADAAPYFRIFNPVLQGKKFDPDGAYVRRFVPELKDLPDEFIHNPWDAPEIVLADAGVKIGETYPKPIIALMEGRTALWRPIRRYRNRKMVKRVAVIGAGISGLSAAWLLRGDFDVTLFEAEQRAGGHADTQTVSLDGEIVPVDTGFIVFNNLNYPNLVGFSPHSASPRMIAICPLGFPRITPRLNTRAAS